ncbi:MAG: hypothetical protein JSU65_01355 [Candidatus Zixiibacteriota bacterium]|nr:MAG: hypothetical protein JSU65_01355 [candidate division Zixibacteria bacterium]
MRQLTVTLLAVVLCLVILSGDALAKSKLAQDTSERIANRKSDNVTVYSLPRTNRELVSRQRLDDSYNPASTARGSSAASLGQASVATSPGLTVKSTYDDWQYWYKGRRVQYVTTDPSIHFTYNVISGAADGDPGSMGYNPYDPTSGGSWPRGLGVGCQIQSADNTADAPNIGVYPNGQVVIAGHDDASGAMVHHMFSNVAKHGCFWGTGSQIEPEQYKPGFIDTTVAGTTLRHPQVHVSVVGTDTVTHLVAGESTFFPYTGAANVTAAVIQYFRKTGTGGMTGATWTGPTTIDTATARPSLCVTPSGNKVAIVYFLPTQWALDYNNGTDQDVVYRESTDGGLSWAAKVNITNYDRTERSYTPWIEKYAMYDSEGYLHALWNANPYPEDVYDSAAFFFNDFTCSLFHWSDRTGVISRIANRDYGLAWNTQVCGMGGYNTLYLAFYSVAECNGRLYAVYSGWNDVFGVGTIDDCPSSLMNTPSRIHIANGEMYMHVSSSLDGLLWDAPRNLTNTYTPGCDSAADGGDCLSEEVGAVAPYGFDSAGYGQELVFPGSELVVVDEGYSGSHYIQVFYQNDFMPGTWASGIAEGFPSSNPMNWMRIGCIDPVQAPQIAYAPAGIGYPQYVNHGDSLVVTVTVTNDGNQVLDCGIGSYEESPQSGWLVVTEDTLVVPAGVDNTRSFDVILNAGGNINNPGTGTVVALNGEVFIRSTADAPRDSVSYFITNFLVADTVANLFYDTVATLQTMLVLDNHGTSGNGGAGGVNLDYTAIGGDCNPNATWYLFDGGPFVIQNQGGGEYTISAGMHNSGGFLGQTVWYPTAVDYEEPAHLTGSNYDGFFSGTAVNQDTTIAVEVTTWAPTGGGDSSNFVIQRYDFFSADGNPHNNLAFGATEDWDIPSDVGSNNNAYVTTVGNTVYFQGSDDPEQDPPGCQENAARFGAQSFLGWYNNTDYNADNCSNDRDYYGIYAARNDSDRFVVDDSDYAEFLWTKIPTLPGQTGNEDEVDIHQVMTFLYDVSLGATDTLTFYTALATVQNGTSADLESALTTACAWYNLNLRNDCGVCGCCVGRTGNVDNDPEDICDIGDLTKLIDFLFISYTPPVCMEEANCDGSGDGVVDMGDLTKLIDFLFISYTPTAPC